MISQIYIVTPSFNSAETIDQTISSVVHQAGDFQVHYHVQDGGSSDGTLRLLQKWRTAFERNEVGIFCRGVSFSFDSAKDAGMYDAISSAFSRISPEPQDWTSWINSDDILLPGAFQLLHEISAQIPDSNVSWITGTTSVLWNNLPVAWGDRPIASEVASLGLCDGTHWSFIQQEGTFFRRWLWDSIDTEKSFRSFRLAGDWNLWREFAKLALIYQVPWSLGSFCRRDGQLSQSQRDRYMAEIDRTIPAPLRKQRLLALQGKPILRRMLETKYSDRKIRVMEYPLSIRTWIEKVAGAEAAQAAVGGQSMPKLHAATKIEKGLVAYDADWQFPAITEGHAYAQARRILAPIEDVCYFAFPWATLIDHLQAGGDRAIELKTALLSLRQQLRSYRHVVTVCQHIYLPRFIELMEEVGVTDVFWSHATIGLERLGKARSIRVYPFPLYPVQATKYSCSENEAPRKYLFSFVGARSGDGYLTRVRDQIISDLSSDPRGFVRSRDKWHYEKVVYEHQIFGKVGKADGLIDAGQSAEFQRLLHESIFSLCPSGSGPNSIRLWEALGAGSIPVILADTYQPPGDPALWAAGAVFCREDAAALRELPDRLATLARDPAVLRGMQHAGHQIWMLYGPDCFVHDIQKLYLAIQSARAAPIAPSTWNGLSDLLDLADRMCTGSAVQHERRTFVVSCTTRILHDAPGFADACERHPSLVEALQLELGQSQLACASVCRAAIERRSTSWPALKALLA